MKPLREQDDPSSRSSWNTVNGLLPFGSSREDLLLILVLALYTELELERTVRVSPLSIGNCDELDEAVRASSQYNVNVY